MAKKPTIKTKPKIKIPVDRQTPRTGFGNRPSPPITRLPPAPKKPRKPKESNP